MLKVYLDLGNISGYLAVAGIKDLIHDTGVNAQWLPIAGIVPRPLSPIRPTKPDDPLAEFKQLRWQAKHDFEMAELVRDCERLGLDIERAQQATEATELHLALLFISASNPEYAPSFVEWAYQVQFEQGRNMLQSDISVKLKGLGLDGDGFLANLETWRVRWQEHQTTYLDLGIHDSPAFVLVAGDDEETFQGRQHLPLLRWRIGGEIGSPPV